MLAARVLLLAVALCIGLAQPSLATDETRLIDQFGRPLDTRDLSGHWLLVYFGYSQCPSVCPAALMKLSATLTRLGPSAESILPLFVSLDPAHDSPATLRAFAGHFSPRLRALTGSPAAVSEAARTFGVAWQRRPGSPPVIDHGLFIYLVAPDGRVVQELHPEQSILEMADQIQARLGVQVRR